MVGLILSRVISGAYATRYTDTSSSSHEYAVASRLVARASDARRAKVAGASVEDRFQPRIGGKCGGLLRAFPRRGWSANARWRIFTIVLE
ncbi:hypothetical protein ACJ51O_01560 [Burkholderia pyrrocinia]|uniref:hypothetical protein n=1 Tax=Burkholderia pyrrocinia TaxID=60550 RepID=UPI0038B435B4